MATTQKITNYFIEETNFGFALKGNREFSGITTISYFENKKEVELELKKLTTIPQEPTNIIEIPRISNSEMFDRNRERADDLNLNHCPCCGKKITNPKYFINSIFGGSVYLAIDKNEYADAWVMGVGSECRKRFPVGYVMTEKEL